MDAIVALNLLLAWRWCGGGGILFHYILLVVFYSIRYDMIIYYVHDILEYMHYTTEYSMGL